MIQPTFIPFIGGRLTEIWGQTEVTGVGMILGGVTVLLTPFAASINAYCMFASRFLLGLFQGPTLPAVHSLVAKWAPRTQLATMISLINAGESNKLSKLNIK